jgi:hypothetical protein
MKYAKMKKTKYGNREKQKEGRTAIREKGKEDLWPLLP